MDELVTVCATSAERRAGTLDDARLGPVIDSLREHGAAVVLDAVDIANGALEVWPGTHLDVRTGGPRSDPFVVPAEWLESRREEVPPVRVPLPKGALLLRDSRMWHRGTTNATPEARPMVALLYTARWFRPYAIDFYADAEPVLRNAGIAVSPRYRESFDHHAWPPDWRLVPRPAD